MPIETNPFGPDGTPVSLLGFGCGAVGGLMVRGTQADRERAIARALEAGVNYFDTAVQYAALAKHPAADVMVGTTVRLPPEAFGGIAAAVTASLEGSLRRLARDRVDVFHLHNAITTDGGGSSLSVRQVLGEVLPAFQALQAAGKLRLPGLTAVGDTEALQQVIDSGAFGSAQVSYNMLNPSAGHALPAGYPAQDYGLLLEHVPARSASACWPAVRSAVRPSAIPLPARRRRRSAPPTATRPTWPARSGCCRWSPKGLPRRCPRRRSGSPSLSRR